MDLNLIEPSSGKKEGRATTILNRTYITSLTGIILWWMDHTRVPTTITEGNIYIYICMSLYSKIRVRLFQRKP